MSFSKSNIIRTGLAMTLLLSACKNSDYLAIKQPEPQAEEEKVLAPSSSTYKLKNLVGGGGQIDILWVIDNSGSMSSYQQSVAANTALFINTFTQNNVLNWKIGLLSSDTDDAPYIGFTPTTELNSSSPTPVNSFVQAVSRLGTGGDAIEKTYDPIMKAINLHNDFLRPNADLAIIVVSDAPEQSIQTSTTAFVDHLKALKGGKTSKISFYGILGPKDWCTPTDDEWLLAGSTYQDLENLVKSRMFPICDNDFGQHLLDIGNDIVKQVTYPKAYLSSLPRLSTLKVFYKGREIPGGPAASGGYWTYDPEIYAVVFHDLSFAPGDDEEVQIEYAPASDE